MKIHSSSLNFSATGYPRYDAGKRDLAATKVVATNNALPHKGSSTGWDELSKAISNPEFAIVNSAPALDPTLNSKTRQALNAYRQELNQPLQNRSFSSGSGIDTYA